MSDTYLSVWLTFMSNLVISEINQVAVGIYLYGLADDTSRNIRCYSDVGVGGFHALMLDADVVTLD